MEQQSSFIHTGINHTRVQQKDPSEFYYILDPIEYASAIQPVTLPELMKLKGDYPLQRLLQNCCMTLSGATAWLLQMRMEVAVYVSALQRHMHSPRAFHLRRLNRIIRWAQTQPTRTHVQAIARAQSTIGYRRFRLSIAIRRRYGV